MCKLFYVPGHDSFIDYAREIVPGAWIAQHSGQMLVEIQVDHPGAVLGDEASFARDQAHAFATNPEVTTRTRYERTRLQQRILEVNQDAAGDSYKLASVEQGNLVRIFVRWGGRYWTFIGLATLPHQVIIRRIALHALHANAS
jgi:long-subunit fatty acid transport protein